MSVTTIRRLEGTLLHPQRGPDGVHRFDPSEVEQLALRRKAPRTRRSEAAGLNNRHAIEGKVLDHLRRTVGYGVLHSAIGEGIETNDYGVILNHTSETRLSRPWDALASRSRHGVLCRVFARSVGLGR